MKNNKPQFTPDEQAAYIAGCAGVLDAIAVAAGPDGAVVLTSSTELPADAVAADYQVSVEQAVSDNHQAVSDDEAIELATALRPLVMALGESPMRLWPRDVLLAYHHARCTLATWDRKRGVDVMPAVDPDELVELRRVV